jgi:hypothetical protein
MEASSPSASSAGPAANVTASMLKGCVGFSLVSVIGFSVWAFPGRWLSRHFGEFGMFAACAVAFIGAAGLLLFHLVAGPNRLWRFYKVFVPAFLAYAIAWCVAWFIFKFGFGEWLGSFLGSIAFVAIAGWGFRTWRGFWKAVAVLFLCHSAGYFLGAEFMRSVGRAASVIALSKSTFALVGMLGWGAIYGAGFGAGIGFVFHTFQADSKSRDGSKVGVPLD